jgi:hypothetical protein
LKKFVVRWLKKNVLWFREVTVVNLCAITIK